MHNADGIETTSLFAFCNDFSLLRVLFAALVWHFRSSHDHLARLALSSSPSTAPGTLHRALNMEVVQIEGCLGETALIPRIPLSKKKHSEPLVPARATFHPFRCSHPFLICAKGTRAQTSASN